MISYILIFLIINHINHNNAYWAPCSCNKYSTIIPGGDIIIGGYDHTILSTNQDKDFKSPIFQYSGSYTCMKNILDPNATCYIIPKELSIIDIDSSIITNVEDLYSNYYEHIDIYASSYTCSTGIGVPDFSFSINYHQELYESDELLDQDYQAMGYSYFGEFLYKLILPPAYVLTLNDIFKYSLDALPSIIITEQDNDKYNEFLDSFGCMYISSINLGGAMHMSQYVESSYILEYSYSETITEMGVNFNAEMFNMNFGYYSNSSSLTITKEYAESSTYSMYCYGGDINQECGSQSWKLSIINYPGYTNLTSIPIYYLVTDDVDKYNTLKTKTLDYIHTGVLN